MRHRLPFLYKLCRGLREIYTFYLVVKKLLVNFAALTRN